MTSTTDTITTPATGPCPDTSFHRLARVTPRYHWWRPVTGTLLVFIGLYTAMNLPTFLTEHVAGIHDDFPLLGRMTPTALHLAGIALALPIVLVVTRWTGARPAGTIASVTARLRWRRLAWCLPLAVITVLVILARLALLTILANSGPGTVTPVAPAGPLPADAPAETPSATPIVLVAFMVTLAVILTLTVMQTTTEELVFRGFLLQAVSALTHRAWAAIAVQAVIFTLGHGLHNSPWRYLELLVYSIIVGWLTIATGGIEAAAALHIVWNSTLLFFTVIAVSFNGFDPTTAQTPVGANLWHMPAAELPAVGAYAVVVWLISRRLQANATSPTGTQAATRHAPVLVLARRS